MNERVETTDKEREELIKKDMEEMKKRYTTVSDKLWSLETRMDTMSTDQAESSCAIQFKLDVFLRNSVNQDKAVVEKRVKQTGTRVRNKNLLDCPRSTIS